MSSHADRPENSQTRVLLVDDDREIRELVCSYLTSYNMYAEGVENAQAMRAALARDAYDVLLLDLMLPGEDGLSLCRELRAHPNFAGMPIIMLTARGESVDRVLGLEMGADDYLVKPFDPRELVARIHTILRRIRRDGGSDGNTSAWTTTAQGNEVRFDAWRLNRTLRQLHSPEGLVVPLSNAEFRLLWAFLERPQRVLTRDQLMDAARGRTMDAFDRSIDLLVSRLRQKIGDDPKQPRLIKTVRGEGYVFDAVVQR